MRKINEDDILDAAERVVVRDGAVGLSIDAVAREASVSKSRVVYDHKSCQRRSKIRPMGGVKVGHLRRRHETAGRA